MPLVPRSQIVFIEDPSNGNERLMVVLSLGADLERGTVRRQIGHLPDFFEIDVGADEDGFAIFADGLHAARPSEHNFRTAVRTNARRLGHRLSLAAWSAS